MELEVIQKLMESADTDMIDILAIELLELKRATNEQIEEITLLGGAIYNLRESHIEERERIDTLLRGIHNK